MPFVSANLPSSVHSSVPGAGRQAASCAQDCITYGWSHNWAAVVGILLCLALLQAWFDAYTKSDDAEEA